MIIIIIQGRIADRSECDVIYIDLAKAFDNVNHNIILKKLRGLAYQFSNCFKSYLTHGAFSIKLDNFIFEKATIKNVIPLVSPLGSLLFNLYINYLCDVISNSSLFLYLDDLKIFG